jgi:hypothetical protein
MSTRTVEPALNSILRFRDCRANRMLGGGAVSVSRCPGDAAFPFQTLAQLIVGLAYVLAQNVAASGFVLAEVTHWTVRRTAFGSCDYRSGWCRTCVIRGSGWLARDQDTQSECECDANYRCTNRSATNSAEFRHSAPKIAQHARLYL